MNLLARYNMLRTAVVAMIGVADDVDTMKQMASILRVPAMTDSDAAASLLVLQTLITTHGTTEQEVPDAWVSALRKQFHASAGMTITDEYARDVLKRVIFGWPQT